LTFQLDGLCGRFDALLGVLLRKMKYPLQLQRFGIEEGASIGI